MLFLFINNYRIQCTILMSTKVDIISRCRSQNAALVQRFSIRGGGENLWRPLHEMQFSRDNPSVHCRLQRFPRHALLGEDLGFRFHSSMFTQADSKQHYFETAVEHEISSSNICSIILKFSYDFIALTALSFDTQQNKNIRKGTDCLVLITQRRTVLNKQTSVLHSLSWYILQSSLSNWLCFR